MYNFRKATFRKKKILQGKTENCQHNKDSTKKRAIEMKIAQATYSFNNAWSQDGKILYPHANDRNKIKVFYD